MRHSRLLLTIAVLAVVAPLLAACEDFDVDKFDIFHLNDKKKLPGERRAVFPEGVPGVSQGVPQDLVKGYQPPAEAAPVENAAESAEAEKPKPAPKPKAARKPKVAAKPQPPAPATAQPAAQSQAQQPADPAWSRADQQRTTQQQGTSAPWPSAPAPGTFQR